MNKLNNEAIKMKSHKFLEHTADVLFEASGSSFEETLEECAVAMFETIADISKVTDKKKIEVSETAPSLEELVLFTLANLLSQMDAEELFFKKFEVTKFGKNPGKDGNYFLSGTAFGSPMDPKIGKIVVKAVTHHLLKVEEKDGKWKIRVLIDI